MEPIIKVTYHNNQKKKKNLSNITAGFHPKKYACRGWVREFNYENAFRNGKHFQCIFSFYNLLFKIQRIK